MGVVGLTSPRVGIPHDSHSPTTASGSLTSTSCLKNKSVIKSLGRGGTLARATAEAPPPTWTRWCWAHDNERVLGDGGCSYSREEYNSGP